MSYTDFHGRLRRRSRVEAEGAMAKIDTRTIVIEWVVVKQDIMVVPFAFINGIFQENGLQSLFTSNKLYPKLVLEFYKNMKSLFTSTVHLDSSWSHHKLLARIML
jgi:hypothetical protein